MIDEFDIGSLIENECCGEGSICEIDEFSGDVYAKCSCGEIYLADPVYSSESFFDGDYSSFFNVQ